MKFIRIVLISLLGLSISNVNAQTTVGLIQNNGNTISDGYTLFSPMSSFNSYLIDRCGK
jgi:hypothetical protein